MENGREVKKSFCILSVAYLVIGMVLLLWPDISVHTFCFVFGIGMIIFGGAYLIIYFTKDKYMRVMQPDLVVGVVCTATGAYILMKMEYMLELIPFAMGIVALLGGIVKIQSSLDLRRLNAARWYIMLVWSLVLLVLGIILIANPFDEQQELVVMLIAVSLLLDGIGNLVSIFWTGIRLKRQNVTPAKKAKAISCKESQADSTVMDGRAFFRKKSEKEKKTGKWYDLKKRGRQEEADLPEDPVDEIAKEPVSEADSENPNISLEEERNVNFTEESTFFPEEEDGQEQKTLPVELSDESLEDEGQE